MESYESMEDAINKTVVGYMGMIERVQKSLKAALKIAPMSLMKKNDGIIVQTKKQNCRLPQAWAFLEKDFDEEDEEGDSDYRKFANASEARFYFQYMKDHAKDDANGVWQAKIAQLALEALEQYL